MQEGIGVWIPQLCTYVQGKFFSNHVNGATILDHIPKEFCSTYCDRCKHRLYFTLMPSNCYSKEIQFEEIECP